MSDKYELLSKHFLGETVLEEEKEIAAFKRANPDEYAVLAKLWKKEGVVVKDFDSKAAWLKVKQKANPIKVVPMYKYLRIAASIAAVAALVFFLSIFIRNAYFQSETEMLMVEATARERDRKVDLPDGSVVYLNRNARLQYPEAFDQSQRKVRLEGEAFFEVAEDASRPFLITTNHSEVKVLGTSFNINTNLEETEVVVATGKVTVKSLFEDKSAVLTPNQSAVISKSSLKSFPTKDVNYLAWKTGEFSFREKAIVEVIEGLNEYYSEQIQLVNKKTDCFLTASFNKDDLSEILEIIQLTCDLKINKKENYYELY